MSQRIAEEDITEVNGLGQTVVVVAKGCPIPEGFDSARTGLRSTEAAANGKSDGVTAPPPPAPAEVLATLLSLPDDQLETLVEGAFAELVDKDLEVLVDKLRDRGLVDGGPADLPEGVVAGETPGFPVNSETGDLLELDVLQRIALAELGLSGSIHPEDVDALVAGDLGGADDGGLFEIVVPGETPGWPTNDDGTLVELSLSERWAAVLEALQAAETAAAEATAALAAKDSGKKTTAKKPRGGAKKG